MNPQEPVLPEPDAPPNSPANPVQEPPELGGIDAYDVVNRMRR